MIFSRSKVESIKDIMRIKEALATLRAERDSAIDRVAELKDELRAERDRNERLLAVLSGVARDLDTETAGLRLEAYER